LGFSNKARKEKKKTKFGRREFMTQVSLCLGFRQDREHFRSRISGAICFSRCEKIRPKSDPKKCEYLKILFVAPFLLVISAHFVLDLAK
jgi:hypothetical protein